MNANASASFFTNLRGAGKTASSSNLKSSRSAATTDKENTQNSNNAEQLAQSVKAVSKLRRPKTASAILQSKSTDIVNQRLDEAELKMEDLTVNQDPEEEEQGPISDFIAELRASTTDFDEVLKVKISSKCALVTDMKKRMEEQKQLILKLRDAVQELLTKRDTFITKAVSMSQEMVTNEAKAQQQASELSAQLSACEEDLQSKTAELKAVEAALATARADFAAACEERDALESKINELERVQESERREASEERVAALAVKAHRDQILREGAESKQLADTKQAGLEKDVQELRQQLGQEMVSRNDFEKKYLVCNDELAQVKAGLSAIEETNKSITADVVRLASERDAVLAECDKVKGTLQSEIEALRVKNEESITRVADMQTRMDLKEAQHNDTVRSLIGSQEMQTRRIAELCTEKDAVAAEAARCKKESEEATDALMQERHAAHQLKLDLHMADTELARANERAEGAQKELETLRASLNEATSARATVQERLAVVEAEYKVFKEQNKFPHMEQLEQFCRLQVESQAVMQAKSATEGDLMHERMISQRLREENQELAKKLLMAETARRKLHNEVQELKGNVRTFMRLRPSSRRDSAAEEVCPVEVDNEGGSVSIQYNGTASQFKFDRAFGQDAKQEDIFEEVRDFVQSALDGFSVSLLAYGQTGAGKTHTMIGGDGMHMGLIPRSLQFILATVQKMSKDGWEHVLQATCVEIYNDSLRDLLVDPAENANKTMQIRQGEYGMMNVSDLSIADVESVEDVERLMKLAEKHRTVKGTDMNERSSRSHTVFQLRITGTRTLSNGSKQGLFGSLNLVDLAGSERLDKSGATGERLKETQAINKSLSALGDVFTAISKKQSHIPFRNSKLTHLLQPSLSGDGKALVLIAVSSAETSAHESLCSLRFSSLVSQCELGKPTKHLISEPSSASSSSSVNSSTLSISSCASSKDANIKRPLTAPTQASDKKRRT